MAGMTVAGSVDRHASSTMAPEQAKGKEADHRAESSIRADLPRHDGVEARRQHARVSALDELQARMAEVPAGPRSIDAHIPTRSIASSSAVLRAGCRRTLSVGTRADCRSRPVGWRRETADPGSARSRAAFVGSVAAFVLALLGVTWWLARTPPAGSQPPPIRS